MVVQAFIDDSGGKGQTDSFFLAGLVSDAERWAAFSDEWKAFLNARPSISYFTMKHAAHLTGEFENWKVSDRDDKLRGLARIINRYAVFATYCGVNLAAHAATYGNERPKPFNDPYFLPFQVVIMGVCLDLWEVSEWREPFEIIFDEQAISGPRSKYFYPIIREIVAIKEPEAATIMPVEPMFRKDTDFRPLQAADLFAWCFRRNTDNPNEESFQWLLEELKDVSEARYCNYYDEERLNALFAESNRLFLSGDVPKEVVRKFKELWDASPFPNLRRNRPKRLGRK